jgi:hypothetical protein
LKDLDVKDIHRMNEIQFPYQDVIDLLDQFISFLFIPDKLNFLFLSLQQISFSLQNFYNLVFHDHNLNENDLILNSFFIFLFFR